MNERVAGLESSVNHIQRDVAEIKVAVGRLDEKIDRVEQKLIAKIETVDEKLSAKIEGLKDALTALTLSVEKQFGGINTARILDRVWWLLNSGALLGIVAHALEWI